MDDIRTFDVDKAGIHERIANTPNTVIHTVTDKAQIKSKYSKGKIW